VCVCSVCVCSVCVCVSRLLGHWVVSEERDYWERDFQRVDGGGRRFGGPKRERQGERRRYGIGVRRGGGGFGTNADGVQTQALTT